MECDIDVASCRWLRCAAFGCSLLSRRVGLVVVLWRAADPAEAAWFSIRLERVACWGWGAWSAISAELESVAEREALVFALFRPHVFDWRGPSSVPDGDLEFGQRDAWRGSKGETEQRRNGTDYGRYGEVMHSTKPHEAIWPLKLVVLPTTRSSFLNSLMANLTCTLGPSTLN